MMMMVMMMMVKVMMMMMDINGLNADFDLDDTDSN